MSATCTLCGAPRQRVFNALMLRKYDVDYFHCDRCGLLQTEEPYWLEEAYADAIADADTGLVLRNQAIARRLSALLYFFCDRDGAYLDSAGGYGLLVRLMRDIGFDFYWHDEYCENLFARGFEAGKLEGRPSAVTAFEVLEHVPNPLEFIQKLLDENDCRTLFFTTELYTGAPPDPGDWWYYSVETGQHISFYQARTLQYLAKELSLDFHTCKGMHVLTDRPINPRLYNFLTGKGSWLGNAWSRSRLTSRTFPDHESVLENLDGGMLP